MFPRAQHTQRWYMSNRVVALLALAVAVTTAQGQHPEDCRLYQVTVDHPSPILEVSSSDYASYISLGLLFQNSSATISISVEGSDEDSSNSCEMTVNKANGTIKGSCYKEDEIPLICSQDEGMDTIKLGRNRHLLMASIEGDKGKLNVLTGITISPSDIVKVQVTSHTIVNTAFNCLSNCFEFNNGIIHSFYELTLSAKQIAAEDGGNSTGVIKVIHGEDLGENTSFDFKYPQEGNESMALEIDYPQKGAQEGDRAIWKQFNVTSQYANLTTHDVSNYSLWVSGSLFDSESSIEIGYVPSADSYFKFEDMDNILWNTCAIETVSEGPEAKSMPDVTQEITDIPFEGIVWSTTEEIATASDGQNTELFKLETGAGETVKDSDISTALPVHPTTKRFVEEISCKDTMLHKCTITEEHNASCNCGEAAANGWCEDLDNYPHIKEHCKQSCGLCTDKAATSTPNSQKANGNILVYVMIAIVVAMLLVLVIWLYCKKRKASGHMDLESQSQSVPLKESTEKTSENDKDTEKMNKQAKEDNTEGAKNNAFQEQNEVKETTKLNDEKANDNEENKSPTKDESDIKNTDDKTPTDNANATEKDIEDKGDDEPEKNDKVENENENASKGIADSQENEKAIE